MVEIFNGQKTHPYQQSGKYLGNQYINDCDSCFQFNSSKEK